MSNRRERQYGAHFDFENNEAGVFYEGEEPASDGVVEYMPVRSFAHLDMHRTVEAQGIAHCTFRGSDGKQRAFGVVGSPGYGLLTIANLRHA